MVLRGYPETAPPVYPKTCPKGGRPPGADVAPSLITKQGVLQVVHRAGTIPTGTVPSPGYPRQVGVEYTVPGERLRGGK